MKKFFLFFLTLVFACASVSDHIFLVNQSNSKTKWVYSSEKDEMDGSINRFAVIQSLQSLDLDFPYHGVNFGSITIIKNQKNRMSAFFSIQRGQLMCYSFQPCSMLVRFDEDPPIRFTASGVRDPGTTTIAFIDNHEQFIELLSRAKTIKISMPIYGNGTQILNFETPTPLE